MAQSRFRLALIQLAVCGNKADNIARACKKISEAASGGANVIALPECFNSPYGNEYFPEYAEPIPGASTEALSKAAAANNIFLIGGSIPERDGEKLYNTCTVFNPSGNLIAKFRKAHLFDVNIPGKITFQESKTITRGDELVAFDTPYCRIGLGICFDIRFPQMAKSYIDAGCKVLVYPGAFNMTSGPAHWELLTRARALDGLAYVACCSPARDENASYVAWGHSLVVNPWGEVIANTDEKEDIVYADIDVGRLDEIRQQIPVLHVDRPDFYQTTVTCDPLNKDA